MSNFTQFAVGIISTIALSVSGYFASNQSALVSRIGDISAKQAATDQKAIDIDSRLTRIENKLDQVISTKR